VDFNVDIDSRSGDEGFVISKKSADGSESKIVDLKNPFAGSWIPSSKGLDERIGVVAAVCRSLLDARSSEGEHNAYRQTLQLWSAAEASSVFRPR
jgi:hypothetical protein